jgi:hypothetical protein
MEMGISGLLSSSSSSSQEFGVCISVELILGQSEGLKCNSYSKNGNFEKLS